MRQADWMGPLQKKPDGTERPIEYWTRVTSKAQGAYITTQQECFNMTLAVLLLWPYLE